MHPYLEEARDQIADQYKAQLAACDGIRDHAIALIENWTGRPLDPQKGDEAIMAAIFARSLNTYWAAIELTRIGFGEQAAMLNRSLFEDMIDAHWVSTEPALAVERYERHHEHSKMLLADAVTAYPDYFPSDKIPEFSPEERRALDGVFGRYGAGSWTALNLHEKVAAIEHLWGDERNRETLRFFRDIAHRENNQMLHLSAHSLGQVVHCRGPEGIAFQLGPGGDFIDRALFGSFWIFIQTLTLLLDLFEFERDRDAEADLFSDAPFRKPAANELQT